MTLDEGHYYIYFCCDNLWKSKFMALEKSGKLGIFFSYFMATLHYSSQNVGAKESLKVVHVCHSYHIKTAGFFDSQCSCVGTLCQFLVFWYILRNRVAY